MCPAHTGATREHVGTGPRAFHPCGFVPRAHLAQQGCRGPWGGCSAPFPTGSMRPARHAARSPYSLKHPVRKAEASLFTDDFDAETEVVRRQQARVPAPWVPPPSQGPLRARRSCHGAAGGGPCALVDLGEVGPPPQRFSISRASTSPFVMGGGRRDFPGCCKLGSEFDLGAQFSANRKLK